MLGPVEVFMRRLCRVICLAGSALAVMSGSEARGVVSARILSATPSLFRTGAEGEVVVTAINDGDSAEFVLRWDTIPTGWSITPTSYNGFVPSGATVEVPFTVTPLDEHSAGTIIWNLYEDRLFFDTLLDIRAQDVQSIGDGEPSAALVSPGSPVTVQQGVSQTFVADGEDLGGDLDYAEWTLSGPDTDSKIDPILPTNSNARSSYTYAFGQLGAYDLSCRFYDDDGDYAEVEWQIEVVEPPQADLIVSNMLVPSQRVVLGQHVTVEIDIRNAGELQSPSGMVALFARWGSPSFSPSHLVDAWRYPSLAPGQTYITVGSFTVPLDAFPGTWSVSCEVDITDTTDESNEANNRTETAMIVEPPPLPDLVIGSVTISPSFSWQPSTVSIQILNRGPGGSDAGNPRMEPVARVLVDGEEVDALGDLQMAPYSSQIVTQEVTLSTTGSFHVVVTADPNRQIHEWSEGNNEIVITHEWTASTTDDSDGDHLVDADELVAGTDPGDITDVLACTIAHIDNVVVLSWPSVSNRIYGVDISQNPTGAYSTIASSIAATPPQNTFTNWTESNSFYRVSVHE